MNIITRIIFFIIIVFSLNIIVYYMSEDYRFFIKKIKNTDKIIYTKKTNINDKIINSGSQLNKRNEIIIKEKPIKKEVILGKNYKDIINIFSKYKLEKLEAESSLFDLTDEYPDKYYEYYSPELTLYLFTTKSYSEVKDIMKVISYEVPYKIKEINNFGKKSFYINLKKSIEDNNIRLVITNKNITFGLKIKKNIYNDVKKILNSIKERKKINIKEKQN